MGMDCTCVYRVRVGSTRASGSSLRLKPIAARPLATVAVEPTGDPPSPLRDPPQTPRDPRQTRRERAVEGAEYKNGGAVWG